MKSIWRDSLFNFPHPPNRPMSLISNSNYRISSAAYLFVALFMRADCLLALLLFPPLTTLTLMAIVAALTQRGILESGGYFRAHVVLHRVSNRLVKSTAVGGNRPRAPSTMRVLIINFESLHRKEANRSAFRRQKSAAQSLNYRIGPHPAQIDRTKRKDQPPYKIGIDIIYC